MTHPNRRSEDRLPILRGCQLEIKAPPWALLPAPLPATAQNLTRNGAKLFVASFPTERYERWRIRVDEGETLSVVVHMPLEGEELHLPGTVVWLSMSEKDRGGRSGECSLGVLLSLLGPEQEEALKRGLRSAGSRF